MNSAYSLTIAGMLGPLAGIVLFFIVVRLLVRMFTHRKKRDQTPPEVRQCRCGYPLVGLSIPRCPECGRAIGFDRTFAEMGISEEEVHRNVEARRAQRTDDAGGEAKI